MKNKIRNTLVLLVAVSMVYSLVLLGDSANAEEVSCGEFGTSSGGGRSGDDICQCSLPSATSDQCKRKDATTCEPDGYCWNIQREEVEGNITADRGTCNWGRLRGCVCQCPEEIDEKEVMKTGKCPRRVECSTAVCDCFTLKDEEDDQGRRALERHVGAGTCAPEGG